MQTSTQRTITGPYTILSAKAATGVGDVFDVRLYKNIVLQFSAAASSTATVKIQGSVSEAIPDFAAAQTAANHWDYISFYDAINPTGTPGSTGVVYSSVSVADSCLNIIVNTAFLNYLTCEVASISAGNVTVKAIACTD